MQCRLPRKNVPTKKSSLTWYLNETISWTEAVTYEAAFTCNGASYEGIRPTYTVKPKAECYIQYINDLATKDYLKVATATYDRTGAMASFKWVAENYRTITFDAPPTGDLLTWLEANASQ